MHANHYIPEGYASALTLKYTQQAIRTLKDCFQRQLSGALNLTRVSAPLFVRRDSGLNDDLNGIERKVSFDTRDEPQQEVQVVQSLAKWKRDALGRYGYEPGEGIYTDMNAIRRDETTDNIHSVYVDQWDWEKVILREQRTMEYLYRTAGKIHGAILESESVIFSRFPALRPQLPAELFCITSEELLRLYPDKTAKERENLIAREHGAVFISQIGWPLSGGERHDGRAPDYDDWNLNGDLIYWHPVLGCALEISSMGIRVDSSSMFRQLRAAQCLERMERPFHTAVLEDKLPLTIGGGIGQSRLCMLLLRKAHLAEVQVSVWPEEVRGLFAEHGIPLL
ncbi:MAG: aspartate--ammonia ligase [Eubacteriales bacterium]|nr:aspartate--ammonia ligase [Eubacteriales bacterium]